jgi:hypothetical protein
MGSERISHAYSTRTEHERRAHIRALNDGLRRYARAGCIYLTTGVLALGPETVEETLRRVRDFDMFTRDNDPFDEHDMGVLDVAGERIMWKIDYYDLQRRFGSRDPADPAMTTRILTIMLASEY